MRGLATSVAGLIAVFVLGPVIGPAPAQADGGRIGAPRGAAAPRAEALQVALAERFAPSLSLTQNEKYSPKSVDVMVRRAGLWARCAQDNHRQIGGSGTLTPGGLATRSGEPNCPGNAESPFYFLDLPESDNSDPDRYAAEYEAMARQYPEQVTYAIVRDKDDANQPGSTVQYWFFYYFNDWYNRHEGDWEQITLTFPASVQDVLAGDMSPTTVSFSVHGFPLTLPWLAVGKAAGNRPTAVVAEGSHATYPAARWCPKVRGIPIERCADAGSGRTVGPRAELVSGEGDSGWIHFAGRWGEYRADSRGVLDLLDHDGPPGPAAQGAYGDPYCWANGHLDLWTCRVRRNDSLMEAMAASAWPRALTVHIASDQPLSVERTRGGAQAADLPGLPTTLYFDLGGSGQLALVPAVLPGDRYTVAIGSGGSSSGTLTMRVPASLSELAVDGDVIYQFQNIPILTGSGRAQVVVDRTIAPVLGVDADGDGRFESQRSPDRVSGGRPSAARVYLPRLFRR